MPNNSQNFKTGEEKINFGTSLLQNNLFCLLHLFKILYIHVSSYMRKHMYTRTHRLYTDNQRDWKQLTTLHVLFPCGKLLLLILFSHIDICIGCSQLYWLSLENQCEEKQTALNVLSLFFLDRILSIFSKLM